MNLGDRIALGTVQFGLDYGIQSSYHQVSFEDAARIIAFAEQSGINTVDTAAVYGKSEEVIGKILTKYTQKFEIISKLTTKSADKSHRVLTESLRRLKLDQLYGYLIHDFNQFRKEEKIYSVLQDFQSENKIKKIGFSFYFPKDLEYVLQNNIPFDLVQLPYNIFDRRFEPYFATLKEKQVEIHARSIFLQGIFFRNPAKLPEYFDPIKSSIVSLQRLAKSFSIPMNSLCLLFALQQAWLDKLVLGVHTVKQLASNLEIADFSGKIDQILSQLNSYQVEDEKITVPLYWPK